MREINLDIKCISMCQKNETIRANAEKPRSTDPKVCENISDMLLFGFKAMALPSGPAFNLWIDNWPIN